MAGIVLHEEQEYYKFGYEGWKDLSHSENSMPYDGEIITISLSDGISLSMTPDTKIDIWNRFYDHSLKDYIREVNSCEASHLKQDARIVLPRINEAISHDYINELKNRFKYQEVYEVNPLNHIKEEGIRITMITVDETPDYKRLMLELRLFNIIGFTHVNNEYLYLPIDEFVKLSKLTKINFKPSFNLVSKCTNKPKYIKINGIVSSTLSCYVYPITQTNIINGVIIR